MITSAIDVNSENSTEFDVSHAVESDHKLKAEK